MTLTRSLLFVPGNRRDLLDKARNYPADGFVLDLEDSVPSDRKADARAMVRDVIPQFSGRPVWVRINGPDSEAGGADLQALGGLAGLHGFVLPKIEMGATLQSVGRRLDSRETGRAPARLMVTVESALAVLRSFELATASNRVETLMFASARDGDLMTDLGCDWTNDGEALSHARAHVLLSARAARIACPLDGVFSDIGDTEGFERDTRRSRSLGYRGRAVIHPSQIEPANRIYRPTPAEAERSKRLVAAFEKAAARGHASATFEGGMIDIAMANAARRILQLDSEINGKDME